jgi:hypothetical protein
LLLFLPDDKPEFVEAETSRQICKRFTVGEGPTPPHPTPTATRSKKTPRRLVLRDHSACSDASWAGWARAASDAESSRPSTLPHTTILSITIQIRGCTTINYSKALGQSPLPSLPRTPRVPDQKHHNQITGQTTRGRTAISYSEGVPCYDLCPDPEKRCQGPANRFPTLIAFLYVSRSSQRHEQGYITEHLELLSYRSTPPDQRSATVFHTSLPNLFQDISTTNIYEVKF